MNWHRLPHQPQGNGHSLEPRVAADVEGIISVAYLGEVENLTVGHVQVGLGKTGNRHG